MLKHCKNTCFLKIMGYLWKKNYFPVIFHTAEKAAKVSLKKGRNPHIFFTVLHKKQKFLQT